MAKFPWRFQGEIAGGNIDPMTTVFMGFERAVLDDKGDPTGEVFIEQNTSEPLTLTLSAFKAGLEAGTLGADPTTSSRKKGP